MPDDRVRTALAPAQRDESIEPLRRQGKHVTFLCLVAPDFERRHARLVAGYVREFDAAAARRHDLGHGIREAAGSDVVDHQHRVVVAERPAGIDDLLRAPLHLRVAALDGREIELFAACAAALRRSRSAPKADQHRGPAQKHERRSGRHGVLFNVHPAHVAEAARDHDRLVISAHTARGIARHALLERPEVAEDPGAPELVVECGSADRAFQHDVERRGDASRAPVIRFPGLQEIRNAEIRDGESHQAGLWLCAAPGRPFIANLAAGTGGGSRKRRDRGRVIVGLDLDEDVDRLLVPAIGPVPGCGKIARAARPLDHGRIVAVGRKHAARVAVPRMADHREWRLLHRDAVDAPVRIEDLVPAMLAVGLGEHHHFDVGRVASETRKHVRQVGDLAVREREPERGVYTLERERRLLPEDDAPERPPFMCRKEAHGLLRAGHQRFSHRVEEQGLGLRGQWPVRRDAPGLAALDAAYGVEPADARDVGRLRRPG